MSEPLINVNKQSEIQRNLSDYTDHRLIIERLEEWINQRDIRSKGDLPRYSKAFKSVALDFFDEEESEGGYIDEGDVSEFVERKIDLELIDSQVQNHFGYSRENMDQGRWMTLATRTIVVELCLYIVQKHILK